MLLTSLQSAGSDRLPPRQVHHYLCSRVDGLKRNRSRDMGHGWRTSQVPHRLLHARKVSHLRVCSTSVQTSAPSRGLHFVVRVVESSADALRSNTSLYLLRDFTRETRDPILVISSLLRYRFIQRLAFSPTKAQKGRIIDHRLFFKLLRRLRGARMP